MEIAPILSPPPDATFKTEPFAVTRNGVSFFLTRVICIQYPEDVYPCDYVDGLVVAEELWTGPDDRNEKLLLIERTVVAMAGVDSVIAKKVQERYTKERGLAWETLPIGEQFLLMEECLMESAGKDCECLPYVRSIRKRLGPEGYCKALKDPSP